MDVYDIGMTINNWLNGDFFILDPLAFFPIITTPAVRAFFGHGDDIASGAIRSTNTLGAATHFDCSFSADTTVSTPDGDIPISDLQIGDEVFAYNEAIGGVGVYEVTAVWVHKDDNLLYLIVDDELIVTTTDHPFYTDDREWIAAGELSVGETIISVNGTTGIVESVESIQQSQSMYNLTVNQAHTYFMSDGEWLVHNVTFCLPDGKEVIDYNSLVYPSRRSQVRRVGKRPSWVSNSRSWWVNAVSVGLLRVDRGCNPPIVPV